VTDLRSDERKLLLQKFQQDYLHLQDLMVLSTTHAVPGYSNECPVENSIQPRTQPANRPTHRPGRRRDQVLILSILAVLAVLIGILGTLVFLVNQPPNSP
jgi:hypothetical protein